MFTVVLSTIAKQDTYFKEKQDILVAETVNGREKYRPASVSFTVVKNLLRIPFKGISISLD